MFQGLKEEPPLDTECKDKFIIFSTIITPDKKKLALQDIVRMPSFYSLHTASTRHTHLAFLSFA
jgi:hypothetical protein